MFTLKDYPTALNILFPVLPDLTLLPVGSPKGNSNSSNLYEYMSCLHTQLEHGQTPLVRVP